MAELREETNERLTKKEQEDDESIVDVVEDILYGRYQGELDELKEQVQVMKEDYEKRFERVDIFQPRIVYTFKFKDFRSFFGYSSNYLSDFFWVQGTNINQETSLSAKSVSLFFSRHSILCPSSGSHRKNRRTAGKEVGILPEMRKHRRQHQMEHQNSFQAFDHPRPSSARSQAAQREMRWHLQFN